MLRPLCVLVLVFVGAGALAAADQADAETRRAFEKSYEAGTAAFQAGTYDVAENELHSAMKVLGEFRHPKKRAAEILLQKSVDAQQLVTAREMEKLHLWDEAETAWKAAAKAVGHTPEIRAGLNRARLAARADRDAANPRTEQLAERRAKVNTLLGEANTLLQKQDPKAFEKLTDKAGELFRNDTQGWDILPLLKTLLNTARREIEAEAARQKALPPAPAPATVPAPAADEK